MKRSPRVAEVSALAAAALGHEEVRADQGGGVELDELHVLQRHAGAVGDAHSAARVDDGVRRAAVDAPVSARAEDDGIGGEGAKGSREAAQRHGAHHSLGGAGEGEELPLVDELDTALDALFVEGMEHDVARAVRGVAGSRESGATEGALGDAAVLEAGEGTAPGLELADPQRRLVGHRLDGILVGEVVGALDRIEGVALGGVIGPLGVVAEGGVDPSLGGAGVGADGVDLGEDPHTRALVVTGDGGPKARQPPAYDQNPG